MSAAASATPVATTLGTGLALTAAAGLLALAPLVWVMRRDARAFPLLAVFALPFRLPVAANGRTVNLLIPLYVVVAAGVLAHLPALLRARRAQAADGGPGEGEDAGWPWGGWPRLPGRSWRAWLSPAGLQWLLAASVALYALQALYSPDLTKAAENLAFFYLPFLLLFVLLRDVRWTPQLLLACLGVAVAVGVIFAGIGFVEYARKSLFLNPKVVAANQYDNYFRVNSLFFDPNIYGRFLAVAMIALTVVVLWGPRRRDVIASACVLAWLLAGLVTSFSQSSIAALLLGLAVLAAWRWNLRATLYAAGALLAVAAAALVAAPSSLHFGLKGSSGSASNATSGRTKLISGGLELFAEDPVQGHGSGSFEHVYQQHNLSAGAQNATSASHTIPVTVAAEQGIVGLALYLALLVSAFAVLFSGAGRSPPRIAIAACFAALVLHTWTYADFLEDPLTWTLLGIGVALAGRPGARGRDTAARGGDRCLATSSAS
ncbi:MAG TPA: O-antigen ligase family protein [Solirubrobacteraceae bacterium]|nr:O-antigen ligase family protein [Solirubrobacteraceae bacterium]